MESSGKSYASDITGMLVILNELIRAERVNRERRVSADSGKITREDSDNVANVNSHCPVLDNIPIPGLLFADECAIGAFSVNGLQKAINEINSFCKTWDLKINEKKSKVLICKKGNVHSKKEKWYVNKVPIVCFRFKYLGVIIDSRGNWKLQNELALNKGKNALQAVDRCLNKWPNIGVKNSVNIYNALVESKILYNIEIWGSRLSSRTIVKGEGGLRVNMNKKEYLVVGGGGRDIVLPRGAIKAVKLFTYLGSIIHESGSCEPDVEYRRRQARRTIRILNGVLWSRVFSKEIKKNIILRVVESILTYGVERWTLVERLKLERKRNEGIRQMMNMEEPVTEITEMRILQWYGHIRRMKGEKVAEDNSLVVTSWKMEANPPLSSSSTLSGFYNLVIFYNDEVRSEDSPKDYPALPFGWGKPWKNPTSDLMRKLWRVEVSAGKKIAQGTRSDNLVVKFNRRHNEGSKRSAQIARQPQAKRDHVNSTSLRKKRSDRSEGWITDDRRADGADSGIRRRTILLPLRGLQSRISQAQRLSWAGHVARMSESRNAYRVLVGRPEGIRPLGSPRGRWEDNINMDLREVEYDGRDWINFAQEKDRWRAYVRAALNLRVP
ncbi:hypothetical protein ANN_15625 [Periplaneta americana]|uniref:Reverse transcriptase domain-containing protein n=1 Tax=Periplaneta americana TaxID=6978 RepID=A0ABQ8SHR4_PERAM|nr:hypothetical protein ANN_15625 [Periplaneta americana]